MYGERIYGCVTAAAAKNNKYLSIPALGLKQADWVGRVWSSEISIPASLWPLAVLHLGAYSFHRIIIFRKPSSNFPPTFEHMWNEPGGEERGERNNPSCCSSGSGERVLPHRSARRDTKATLCCCSYQPLGRRELLGDTHSTVNCFDAINLTTMHAARLFSSPTSHLTTSNVINHFFCVL